MPIALLLKNGMQQRSGFPARKAPFTRILVALDGSALAEQVLAYVEPLAQQLHARLIVFRARLPPEAIPVERAMPVAHPADDFTALRRAVQAETAAYLEEVAERLRDHGLTVEVEHAEGTRAEMIVAQARHLGADLTALTSHGRGGLGRLVFGSVADEVLQHAPCPVLLVRVSGPTHRQLREPGST
jgi:nucleotide-binding universal stress UspA family protein